MSPFPAHELAVRAHLDVSVTAADGRTGRVVVRDRDGTLDVRLSGTRALLAALPRRSPAAGAGLGRTLLQAVRDGARWPQPVDVRVGDRLVLRRRSSRWRPTASVGVPAIGGALVLATAVLLVVGTSYRLLRYLVEQVLGRPPGPASG